MGTRLVPFLSWEEWESVGRDLFAQGTAENQRGLNRVAAWRYRGRVPVAVESTAELVEIRLRDSSLGCHPAAALPEQSLRCLYAMSLVRFINGVTDQGQKGRAAIPVATLAEAAGLPRLLVDIRHEAVHNELPSLPLLRMAGQQALSWLEANYWSAQKQALLLAYTATQQGLLQLAALQGPLKPEVESTPPKKRKRGVGEEKQKKQKKQKTQHEVLEKERARLVRELVEGGPESLVGAVLESVVSSREKGAALETDYTLEQDGSPEELEKETRREGLTLEEVGGVIGALEGRAPYLPSMLLSEAIQRLAASASWQGPTEPGVNGLSGVNGLPCANGPTVVDGGYKWQQSLKEFALWLLERGGGSGGFGAPLLKVLLRRCLDMGDTLLGGELVTALMTSLAQSNPGLLDREGGQRGEGNGGGLPAKMQALLRLATVTRNASHGSANKSVVDPPDDLETAAQKQRELLHALSQQRFANATEVKERLESGDAQTASPSAREKPSDGLWSLADDWTPCALGTVPSFLHPLGKVASLVWSRGGNTGVQVNGTRNGVPGPEGNGVPVPEGNGVPGPERNGFPGPEGYGRTPATVTTGAEGMMPESDGVHVEPLAEFNGFHVPADDGKNVPNEGGSLDRRRDLGAERIGGVLEEMPRGSGMETANNGDGIHLPVNDVYQGVTENVRAGPVSGGVFVDEMSDRGIESREEAEKANGHLDNAGLCLQGSVRHLSPEEQARIRDGISIL
ncbi:hypothetical protein KFL_000140610 [Klebsormidium nitens]|uniref:Uncharacterized protein n=1 Tax=Klebsormidium nitens TaxID=105231 RepID=A0A1Y1HJ42_KLENI|nr:hypothetical protein KFL_000140610 [Klebsormidium nitens]|eukprot:GAQ78540.1 hypothetical protein KFL_000140610 [Klebsormidium nitens]